MTDAVKTYKDAFTLDNRLKPQAGVTKAKVAAVKSLVESAMSGSAISAGTLKETMTTSDAIFAFAYLTNLNFIPQYDNAPRTWNQIAGTFRVSDFRPATLYSLTNQWQDGVLGDGDPAHVAPVVPEGKPYPFAYMAGSESTSGGVVKRGFKTDFTFEAFINDPVGFIQALPSEMLQVALDTEEFVIYNALISGVGAGQELAGGTTADGTVVAANSPISRAAIARAIFELSQREVNGRKIVVNGGYNIVVAQGQGQIVNFILNQTYQTLQDGSFALNISGYNPLANVRTVESEYVTGNNWYLIPQPGATRRRVLDLGLLIGHETPEIRVENATGTYVGGGAVSPFEGSFDTDSARFRLRQINGGLLWFPDHVVWSDSSGS